MLVFVCILMADLLKGTKVENYKDLDNKWQLGMQKISSNNVDKVGHFASMKCSNNTIK